MRTGEAVETDLKMNADTEDLKAIVLTLKPLTNPPQNYPLRQGHDRVTKYLPKVRFHFG